MPYDVLSQRRPFTLISERVNTGISWSLSRTRHTFRANLTHSLHVLSQKLITPPSEHDSPPTAAARIVKKPLTALIKQRWNEKVSDLYVLTGKGGEQAGSWGREVLYGGDASADGANESP